MDLKELRRLSAENELSLNYVAKDYMISKILNELQDMSDVVFKGGTAINRIYFEEQKRFSEDLDFDYDTEKKPKELVLEIEKEIRKRINFLEIKKPRIMKNIIRLDLIYINPLEHKDKIRLEFKTTKIKEKHSKKIINFGFVPHTASLINSYEKEVLIKHKINCIMTRKEGKDIYDLYYLIKDEKKIKKDKKIFNKLNLLEKEIKTIANKTNHYIPKTKRPDWEEIIKKLSNYFK